MTAVMTGVSARGGRGRRWTEKMEKFCIAFADPTATSYGVARRSAIAAGYGRKCVGAMATSLMKHQRILSRIDELKRTFDHGLVLQAQVTLELVRKEHAKLMQEARSAGDLTNATRNLEALGRTIGAYEDRLGVDITAARSYSKAEEDEARRIAAVRIGEELAARGQPRALPDEPTLRPVVVPPAWKASALSCPTAESLNITVDPGVGNTAAPPPCPPDVIEQSESDAPTLPDLGSIATQIVDPGAEACVAAVLGDSDEERSQPEAPELVQPPPPVALQGSTTALDPLQPTWSNGRPRQRDPAGRGGRTAQNGEQK